MTRDQTARLQKQHEHLEARVSELEDALRALAQDPRPITGSQSNLAAPVIARGFPLEQPLGPGRRA